ncbi:MAG: hypothetical protein K2N40_01275 [Ureaplasma sp.]|nr:hypothetical protein [Ureaplasma sp.]
MSLGIVGLASAVTVPTVVMSSCNSTSNENKNVISKKVIIRCGSSSEPNYAMSYAIFDENDILEKKVYTDGSNGYKLTLNDLKTMSNLQKQNKNVFYFTTFDKTKLTLSEYMETYYSYFA